MRLAAAERQLVRQIAVEAGRFDVDCPIRRNGRTETEIDEGQEYLGASVIDIVDKTGWPAHRMKERLPFLGRCRMAE